MAKLALQFKRIEQNFKPHIVHCHYGSVTSLFTVLCAKAPVIITFHGSDLNCTPWIGRYRDRFGRTCSQCAILGAARTICVSEHLQNLLFWKKKFSNVIPIGTDTNEFVPMNREACRRLLKWNLSDKVVLFNANKALIKRLDIAENAIKVARKKVNELRMEVMDGNVDPIMLPVYMNASNCVLLCSDNEGSPTIIKEAMACNIPVISIDVGDVKQNLVDISPGGIYEKNHFSLAEGIIKVIEKNSPSNGREKLIERGLTSQALDFKVVQVYMEMVKFQHPDLVPEPAYSVPVEDDITIEILAKDLQV
jgi:glycosyltransferase involved in cell wall biosynthesis